MTIFNVSNATELQAALSQASGGDEIRLAGGDYGEISFTSDAQFTSEVRIVSADPDDVASFSRVTVKDASNLTFDNIKFDYTYSSDDGSGASRFRVIDSSEITFVNSEFSGDFASGTGTTADGTGYGRGLAIEGSSNIDIIDSEFHSWWKAISVTSCEDVNLIGNDIHTIRSDGINVGRSDGVLIEDNYIHDFGGAAGSGDHRDMIQVMRASEEGSSNITIRDNVFDVGEGDYTQTIFFGSDKADASNPDDWHYNVVIEGNMIYNNHTNGIVLSMVDGLEITNNTLIAVPREIEGGITIPKILSSSENKNVTIEGNVTSDVAGYEGQSDWNVGDNVLIQNESPMLPGYYGNLFTVYATSAEDGYNQYGVISGSAIDNLNAGSPLAALFPMSYDDWVGGETSVGTSSIFDSLDADVVEPVPSEDPVDSGTGGNPANTTTAEDPAKSATGEDPVQQDNIEAPQQPDEGAIGDNGAGGEDGAALDEADSFIEAFDDYVLDLSKGLDESGQVDSGYENVRLEADGESYSLVFEGEKSYLNLGRLEDFQDSGHLAFTVEFARDEADGSTQRLVWNHKKIGLDLKDDGLRVKIGGDWFEAEDLGLNDTDTHRISVLVDQDTDQLQVLVDDLLVLNETDTDLDFVGNGGREWGWRIGTPWGRDVDGTLTDFRIDDDFHFVDGSVFSMDEQIA